MSAIDDTTLATLKGLLETASSCRTAAALAFMEILLQPDGMERVKTLASTLHEFLYVDLAPVLRVADFFVKNPDVAADASGKGFLRHEYEARVRRIKADSAKLQRALHRLDGDDGDDESLRRTRVADTAAELARLQHELDLLAGEEIAAARGDERSFVLHTCNGLQVTVSFRKARRALMIAVKPALPVRLHA